MEREAGWFLPRPIVAAKWLKMVGCESSMYSAVNGMYHVNANNINGSRAHAVPAWLFSDAMDSGRRIGRRDMAPWLPIRAIRT